MITSGFVLPSAAVPDSYFDVISFDYAPEKTRCGNIPSPATWRTAFTRPLPAMTGQWKVQNGRNKADIRSSVLTGAKK